MAGETNGTKYVTWRAFIGSQVAILTPILCVSGAVLTFIFNQHVSSVRREYGISTAHQLAISEAADKVRTAERDHWNGRFDRLTKLVQRHVDSHSE